MKLTEILARFESVTDENDGGYLARCPAHYDSRPSLRIWFGDDGKARITCRAGCDFDDVTSAVKLRASDMFNVEVDGLSVPKEKPKVVSGAPIAALAQYVDLTAGAFPKSVRVMDYAWKRFGLTPEAARELSLGYDYNQGFPYTSPAFTAFPRLTVPLNDFAGIPRGLQGRDLSGECPGRWVSLRNPEGLRWAQYGVFRGGAGYGATIVSEGPGDALTVVAVGYDAVAIRGAALASSPELMEELAAGLKGTQVIAAGDNDKAGQAFNRKLAEGLKPFGITVYEIIPPEPGMDLTEWREFEGDNWPDMLHHVVKNPYPVPTSSEIARVEDAEELSGRTGSDTVSADQGHEAARLMAGLIKRYGKSDATNAHALIAWTDGRIRYAPGLGFHVWDGRVWQRGDTRVRQEIHRMGAALVLAGELDVSKGFTMTTKIDNLMVELKSVPSVYIKDEGDSSEDEEYKGFDWNRDLLSFRNGVVNLRTGQLQPHNKDDLITSSLNVDYNPDAKAPRWEKFLQEIMPGMPLMPEYLQRLTGYGITGQTREQCFCVFYGKGANGKSVLTDVLSKVFGGITKTTPFTTFEDKSGGIPNDVAMLRGARLVMASEGDNGKAMSESTLKRLTGDDMVSARFMRGEFFSFAPRFLIMMATNHRPYFKGADEGLWRRVKLVPFQRFFAVSERDYGLKDRILTEEREGVVAWAVRGAVDWYANGLQDPPEIKAATLEYRETSDALSGFAPGVYKVTKSDEDRALGSDVFNDYLEWCESENLPQNERWRRTTTYRALEERGVVRRKTDKGITLFGIKKMDTPDAQTGPGIFS